MAIAMHADIVVGSLCTCLVSQELEQLRRSNGGQPASEPDLRSASEGVNFVRRESPTVTEGNRTTHITLRQERRTCPDKHSSPIQVNGSQLLKDDGY
jgi:hypothetical protein